MRGFLTWLVGLALVSVSAASSAQNGRVFDAAISPDGSRLAYIRALDDVAFLEVGPSDGTGTGSVSLRLDTLDIARRFRSIGEDGPWAVEESRAFVGVSFLSGEYLLLSVESTARVVRSGEHDVFARPFILRLADWDVEPMTAGAWVAALAVDAPDHVVTVEPDQEWSSPVGQSNLAGLDGYALDHPGQPEFSTRYTRRNVSLDGRHVRQARRTPASYGSSVGFDSHGQAILGLSIYNGRTIWTRSDDQTWHRVYSDLGDEWESAGFEPERGYRKWSVVRGTTAGLDDSGETVTLADPVGEDGLIIRRFDLASGEISPALFEGAKVDFDGFLLDWRTSRVIGLRWLGEGGGDWYWAEDFIQLANELEALRPQLPYEMIDWDQDLSHIILRVRSDGGEDAFWVYQRANASLTPISG